jgi:hypothetical protein
LLGRSRIQIVPEFCERRRLHDLLFACTDKESDIGWIKSQASRDRLKARTLGFVRHAVERKMALGRPSLLYMWEPYAALRRQGRVVDLKMILSSEHVLTNPEERKVSQQGTVDWMKRWLIN